MGRSDGGRWEEGPAGLSCAQLSPVSTVKSAGNCSSTCFEEKLRSLPLVSVGQLSATGEAASVTPPLASAWVSASGISGPVPTSRGIRWDVCTSPAPRQSHPLRRPPRQALGNCGKMVSVRPTHTPWKEGLYFHGCRCRTAFQRVSGRARNPLSKAALGPGLGQGSWLVPRPCCREMSPQSCSDDGTGWRPQEEGTPFCQPWCLWGRSPWFQSFHRAREKRCILKEIP